MSQKYVHPTPERLEDAFSRLETYNEIKITKMKAKQKTQDARQIKTAKPGEPVFRPPTYTQPFKLPTSLRTYGRQWIRSFLKSFSVVACLTQSCAKMRPPLHGQRGYLPPGVTLLAVVDAGSSVSRGVPRRISAQFLEVYRMEKAARDLHCLSL